MRFRNKVTGVIADLYGEVSDKWEAIEPSVSVAGTPAQEKETENKKPRKKVVK